MKKVLIIEDDSSIAGLYKIVFTKSNYEVEIGENGIEGMAKARSFNPDMILLDIMMPKMNGIQVIHQLKADQTLKHIPVIAISNLTEASAEKEMLSSGVIKFIVKSQFLPDQIVKIVNDYFAK
jgi:DNA-binding response OmpR family regulator